jgi:hypothetical protein
MKAVEKKEGLGKREETSKESSRKEGQGKN